MGKRTAGIRRNTSRLDWPSIRADYVEGWQDKDGRHLPTYRELAAKYCANVDTIKLRGAEENWVNEREHFQTVTDHARQKKLSAVIATASVDFDNRCTRTAKTMIQIIRGEMALVIVAGRKPGADMDKLTLWTQRLSSSLVRAQHVGRVAIGASGDDGLEDWMPEVPASLSFVRVHRAANAAIDPDAA